MGMLLKKRTAVTVSFDRVLVFSGKASSDLFGPSTARSTARGADQRAADHRDHVVSDRAHRNAALLPRHQPAEGVVPLGRIGLGGKFFFPRSLVDFGYAKCRGIAPIRRGGGRSRFVSNLERTSATSVLTRRSNAFIERGRFSNSTRPMSVYEMMRTR